MFIVGEMYSYPVLPDSRGTVSSITEVSWRLIICNQLLSCTGNPLSKQRNCNKDSIHFRMTAS